MKSYDFEHLCRREINTAVRQYAHAGGHMNKLADKAGVSKATVSRIVSNETKYPRFHTIYAILDALGYAFTLTSRGEAVPEADDEIATASPAATAAIKRHRETRLTTRRTRQLQRSAS